MTKERFFQIAMECGLPPMKALADMWETRPVMLDTGIYDKESEDELRKYFTGILTEVLFGIREEEKGH